MRRSEAHSVRCSAMVGRDESEPLAHIEQSRPCLWHGLPFKSSDDVLSQHRRSGARNGPLPPKAQGHFDDPPKDIVPLSGRISILAASTPSAWSSSDVSNIMDT